MIVCTSIISGIDLGPDTELNLAYTAYFASRTAATVRIAYVIDYLLTPPAYLTSYVNEEKKREEKKMAGLQALLNGVAVRAEFHVMMGRLHESFIKLIHETSADLLVIGYKSHLLRPSSSERLIRSIAIPMLVIRGRKADNASPGNVQIRKILCPVDFSDNSEKALSMAKACAGLFSADLSIIHVLPSHRIQESWKHWPRPHEAAGRRFEKELHADAVTKLSEIVKTFDMPEKGKIFQGEPGEMICSVADEGAYDMIVMGARGLSYLQSVLVGSTTESVLKTSPCPVLVVH